MSAVRLQIPEDSRNPDGEWRTLAQVDHTEIPHVMANYRDPRFGFSVMDNASSAKARGAKLKAEELEALDRQINEADFLDMFRVIPAWEPQQ